MTPVSLGLQILQVVLIYTADMFDPFDVGHTQCCEIFLFFRVVGEEPQMPPFAEIFE
jgi:hypothetical protein